MRVLVKAPWIEDSAGIELQTQTSVLLRTSDPAHAKLLPGIDFDLSVLLEDNASIVIKANRRTIHFAGKTRRRATLAQGEACSIGPYTVRIEANNHEADYRLVFDYAPIPAIDENARTSLSLAGWQASRWSVALVAIMAAFAFLTPFLSTLSSPAYTALPPKVQGLLPSRDAWSIGPIHEAHRTAGIGTECEACHSSPFTSIPDSACMTCHEKIREHVVLTASSHKAFTDTTCADCHTEHMEPSRLVTASAMLCIDCHRAPTSWQADMPVVTSFTTLGHPDFKVSLWHEDNNAVGAAAWEMVETTHSLGRPAKEQSSLSFPHDLHLDSDNVTLMNQGTPLDCSSCHRIDSQNGSITPLDMPRDCGSCHRLTLDLDQPVLTLTHGSERVVIAELQSHFARKAAATGATNTERRVQQEIAHQFGSAGCGLCHEVREQPERPIDERWRVSPVRSPDSWYRSSLFDHRPHLTGPGINGQFVSCLDCHAADTSSSANDVLMPVLETCLSCHNPARIESPGICLDCHVFHSHYGTPSIESRGAPIGHKMDSP